MEASEILKVVFEEQEIEEHKFLDGLPGPHAV